MTSVTTGSAELISRLPVPPELTISSRADRVLDRRDAPRRGAAASSAAERLFTSRTAGEVSGSPAICAS